jgi:hypothetical protein
MDTRSALRARPASDQTRPGAGLDTVTISAAEYELLISLHCEVRAIGEGTIVRFDVVRRLLAEIAEHYTSQGFDERGLPGKEAVAAIFELARSGK